MTAGDEGQGAPLSIDHVVDMLRSWQRHWDEVEAIQREVAGPAATPLRRAPDHESALAAARQVCAVGFDPAIVSHFQARVTAALETVEILRASIRGTERRPDPTWAGHRMDATRLTVAVREVVAAGEALEMHFQPIVALADPAHRPVGFEALARFRTTPYEPPNVWLERAYHTGLHRELEINCVRMALAHLSQLPQGTYLTVNVSPETLVSAEFDRAIGDVPAGMVVMEVTEHAIVREYDSLVRAIGALRDRGLLLAVDDAGAGFASFRHVLELQPEIIKLDNHLTRGVHGDRTRDALVRSLVSFAADVGSALIAEGIETASDLAALRDAGVPFGQGYLFARPAAARDMLGERRARRAAQRLRGRASKATRTA